jgi:hypothetical protein
MMLTCNATVIICSVAIERVLAHTGSSHAKSVGACAIDNEGLR